MGDVAIRVEGLGKQYRVGRRRTGYRTLRESLTDAFTASCRRISQFRNPQSAMRNPHSGDSFWALKDVSFEVKRGEVVGFIGPNGAGKSTLLKILSRITEPTEGRAVVHGRLGSLLEVGVGFHPELTGRDNIFLNGAILGITKSGIERRFDEIVDFSGVEQFIDTPVKHYSSGMYMRLAFAVAAHMETDILVIDEVLAVGDASFQKKCLDKMGEVAKGGRTVLFVSHNMRAITRLCSETIHLQHGKVRDKGPSEEVVSRYMNSCLGDEQSVFLKDKDSERQDSFWLTNVTVADKGGNPVQIVSTGQDLAIVVHYGTASREKLSYVWARLQFNDATGNPLFACHSLQSREDRMCIPPQGSLICRINKLPLLPGNYIVGFALKGRHEDRADEIVKVYDGVLRLQVAEGDFFGTGKLPSAEHGQVLVEHSWDLMR